MKALSAVVHGLPAGELLDLSGAWEDASISGVTDNSRQVSAGFLFVAVPGLTVDGHRFIPQALACGAGAVAGERSRAELELPAGMPYLQVRDARRALAWLAAAFYDFPAHRLRVIGVTGTDGKTTTTNLIYHILRAAGWNAGMISTIYADIAGRIYDTGLHTTTPDAPAVQRYLREMVDAGAQAAVLEVTSHGLAQYRAAACAFDTAVVTNITHEHLDYHGTYEAYFEAKARLFWDLSQSVRKPGIPKISVLNADDEGPFAGLSRIPADMVITYGRRAGADIRAEDVKCTEAGIRFRARTPFGHFDVHSPLVGEYNVHNLLAAIAAALAQGIAPAHVQAGIAGMAGLTGRMERIDRGQPFTVIIDFAHTPNALQKALTTARGMTHGRLTVVFGCAGLRDVQKRPMMGRIAAELADRVILTAEDPRTEDLRAINAQIIAGYRESGRPLDDSLLEIHDRAEAIRTAIRLAEPGDLVLITGKGHERSLCIGTVEYPWSDHEAVERALRELGFAGSS